MIALVLSITASTLLFSCFRLFSKYQVRLKEAVVINYIVAFAFSIALAGPGHALGKIAEPSALAGAIMGLFFLYMFNKIGECTQQLGLGVVAIATKMSMVLPMSVFMLLDPADPLTWQKALAVFLAFPAVSLASSAVTHGEKNTLDDQRKVPASLWKLPAIVFLGSGLIDMGFGWFSSDLYMSSDADRLAFASVPFFVAGSIGLVRWKFVRSARPTLNRSTILGGIVLGIVNVGSLFFLLCAYSSMPLPRSAIVPSNNLGIVLATSVAGIVFFKERPSGRNIMGWILASAALLLLLMPS